MIAATVFNNLVSTLENNPALSDYVVNVFKGIRYNIEPDSMPCIMVEIRRNNEIARDFNQIKKIWIDMDVIGWVSQPADPELGIVGKKEIDAIGVLDIENDIRGALQSSNTLGGTVIDIQFETTEFQDYEVENFAVRSVRIPIRLLYKQTDGV